MRRLAVLLPIAAAAGVLVAWRRRRMRAAQAPLAPAPSAAPLARAPHAPAPHPPAPHPPAPHAPAPPSPTPPPPVPSRASPPSAPLPTAEGFASVPWTLVDAPGDRAELTVRCVPPAGMALDRVDAQETPTQVFVTALARRSADGRDDAQLATVETTVRLSGPLGARELVHAPVDDGGDPGTAPL